MNASELRIGNYYNQFGNTEKVSWSTLKTLEESTTEQLWCKPIPLTEEWLLKFGFEKKGVNRTRWIFWKIDLVEDEKGIYSFDESRIYIDINYVHQLQNLYFALTGEELTFKSE